MNFFLLGKILGGDLLALGARPPAIKGRCFFSISSFAFEMIDDCKSSLLFVYD